MNQIFTEHVRYWVTEHSRVARSCLANLLNHFLAQIPFALNHHESPRLEMHLASLVIIPGPRLDPLCQKPLYSSHPLNHPSFAWCHAEAVVLKIPLGTITSTHKFVCNRELGSMRQHSRPNPLSSDVMGRRSPFVKMRHGLVTALLCDTHWPVQPRYRYHHRKLSLIFFLQDSF